MLAGGGCDLITRLRVSNYRSLGEGVEVSLGACTALVGPNGSGKSNVADVFRFVAESLRVGLEAAVTARHGIDGVRRWSGGRPFDVSIGLDVDVGGAQGGFTFVIGDRKGGYRVKRESGTWVSDAGSWHYETVDGLWSAGPSDLRPNVDESSLVLPLLAGDARFRPLADLLRSIEVYAVFPDTLREPQKPDPTRPMQKHGGNWCSVLKGLDKEAWGPHLRAALGQLTGDVDDLRVKQIGGYLVAEFRHGSSATAGSSRREKWFDAAQESDGTLRFSGILTALLQEPPLTLIGVEEPELTIHVGALPLLYDYLAEASTRSQVLVTTHSPDLLDRLNADDVRVVERRDGVTYVAPLDESHREAVKQRLVTPGDLLRLDALQGVADAPRAPFDTRDPEVTPQQPLRFE